jgi:hypothetical protein
LVPAIAEYDITLQKGKVTMKEGHDQGRIVSLANNTRSISTNPTTLSEWQQSTLDVLTVEVSLVVNSNASVSLVHSSGPNVYFAGDTSSWNPFVAKHFNYSETGFNMSWHDPTVDVLFTSKYNPTSQDVDSKQR